MGAINVKDYGTRGDVKTIFSRGSMTPDSSVLRLPGAGFTINDVPNTYKKTISISKVGVGGAALKTTINGFNNGDEVILGAKSVVGESGLTVTWGTNDTGNVQKAIDRAEIGDSIIFPPGIYCIDKVRLKSGITLTSLLGAAKSTITQIPDNTTLFVDPPRKPETKPLKGVMFQGLIFDGNFDIAQINLQGEILNLANIDGHSDIKFLNCEARNFSKGLYIRGKIHSLFEIKNCTFTRIVNPIYFLDSSTTDIKITDCKFTDCFNSIEIMNGIRDTRYDTCDKIQIERCKFSGQMNYPIHFGSVEQIVETKKIRGIAATHVTVRGCEIHGINKWWHLKGSADQIALYDVEHFSVTDNISSNGGDGGIIIERGKYGTISGNTCNQNFGPGINISNNPNNASSNIHIDKNICINNYRRLSIDTRDNPEQPAGGIMIYGKDCLITNNRCSDPTPNATQKYGLSIHDVSSNITIGSDTVYPNVLSGPKGDIYMGLNPIERLKSYNEYVKKIDELKPY